MFFIGLLLAFVGMTLLTKPVAVWNITESWKSHEATEPTNFYFWWARFGGILFVLLGVIGMVTSLI